MSLTTKMRQMSFSRISQIKSKIAVGWRNAQTLIRLTWRGLGNLRSLETHSLGFLQVFLGTHQTRLPQPNHPRATTKWI